MSKLTFLGHSAVIVDFNGYIVAIDPWLQGNPMCPPESANPDKIDLIVLTHGHSDHASDTVRLAQKFNSKVAATYELAVILGHEGVLQEQLVYMNKGGTVEVDKIKVSLTNAFHSSSYDTKDGKTLYAGEPCGVVVSDGSNVIYHAGDTSLFSDMKLIKEQHSPNVALLPIGDRFTMGPKEAAVAAKNIGAKINIPIHYATFPLLTGTAEEFSKECGKLDVEATIVKPGSFITF